LKGVPASRQTRIAQTLAAGQVEGASGILAACRGRLRRLFCLDRGLLAFAASNLLEEQFPEVLVQLGLLAPAARADIVAEAARRKARFGAVLEERRVVRAEDLRGAMERHVEALLSSCLEWPDGTAAFDSGHPALDGEITVRLAPISLILSHARRYPAALGALRVRIGPPDLRPVASPEMAAAAAALEPDAARRFVLDRADGVTTAGGIAKSCPQGEEPALRAIYGLLLAGILRPADEHAEAGARVEKGVESELTREEVEARLALASESDHYRTLGIARGASRDRVREAYYALARRYHPDRFRSGHLENLRERVETFFALVTEAYNTLYNPERRAEYDSQATAASQAETGRPGDSAHIARQNFLRGRQLAERKRLAEAAVFLENAARAEPGVAEYRLELGLLLGRSPRRREDAERHLIAAAELNPSMARAYYGLGQLYQRAGRKADAARMFREVLRWEPANAHVSALLASIGVTAEEAMPGGPLRAILKG
jgi:tetratricopeptide (TPR) repeat protein